jgi:hypothetical protein
MRSRPHHTALLEAALTYAALGWPVAPVLHDLADVARRATTDPARISDWWRRYPDAGIALATGGPVDALGVPSLVGRAALARLQEVGLAVGPVAGTQHRYHFLVAAGGRDQFMTHHERLGVPYLDISYHGAGDAILLPPSPLDGYPVRWELSPQGCILSKGQPLPNAAELHGTIAYTALRHALVS